MADVFVSYAAEDRQRVAPLVAAFEDAGLSVWWDRRIGTGASFDREIERELDNARAVVVVWSTASVESDWVRNEASEGLARNVLVPVLIDDVRPPLAFRRAQTARLIGWPQRKGDLEPIVGPLHRLTGGPPSPSPEPDRAATGGRRLSLISAATLLIAAAIGYWLIAGAPGPEPAGERKTIAVLPFDDLGANPGEAYFADGITDEMIAVLGSANPEALGVVARTSARHFKTREATIETIGRELGVDYVIDGSVRRQGNVVRITTHLIQVSDQTQLWAEIFDGTLDDILAVQAEVAQRVTQALTLELVPAAARHQRHNPVPAAYEAYLAGRFWAHYATGEGWRQAITKLEEATHLDPQFAPAYAALADAYANDAVWGGTSAQAAYAKARIAAHKAVQLAPSLAEAQAALAIVKLFFERDWDGAESAYRKALSLNPSNGQLLHHFGHYLDFRGRQDEALEAFADALALDPLSAFHRNGRAFTLVNMGQFDESETVLKSVSELNPSLPLGWYTWGMLHHARGDLEAATGAWEKAVALGGPRFTLGALGYAYGLSGRTADALAILEQLERGWADPTITAIERAKVHSGLGNRDQAFALINEAITAREPWIMGLVIDPGFGPLADDPRFREALARIGR